MKISEKMNNSFNILKNKYKVVFSNRQFVISLVFAVILFFVGLFVNFYAALYAMKSVGNSVEDIVLSNIPVFDVDFLVVYGPVFVWFFVLFLCLAEPKKIPLTLKSIALFVLIRSVFITLTHIGPFPFHSQIDYSLDIVKLFTTGGDLFFSAHTGLPFLMALVFGKNNFNLRVIFTLTAMFFGVIVLLAHIHYSIDVLAAFFITYTIYILAEKLFKKDLEFFWK